MIVQKYGGTSVGSAARIRRVSRRIADTVKKGHQVVAVVSAMGRTTDRLIALAQSVNPEPPARELDMLVANGETITAPLVAMCLQGMGVPAVSLSGAQAGVRTSEHTLAPASATSSQTASWRRWASIRCLSSRAFRA